MEGGNINKVSDFSLFLGGPLFQLLMRLQLTTNDLDLLKKRIIYITLFAWLPLLILSIIQGKAWGAGIPFLYDMEAQARFLAALPLLIAAEYIVHKQLRLLVMQFIDRDIVTQKELPKFMDLIASAITLRNSVLVEVILFLLVFIGGHYLWNTLSLLEASSKGSGTWYTTSDSMSKHLSMAGYWYAFISKPLFQFIAFRWYFRIIVWAKFLWHSSKLELNLIPTHPDHACGLGFLGMVSYMFSPLFAAHGFLLAGYISNAIFFTGAKLTDFAFLISSVLLFLLFIVLGPLIVFLPNLTQAKRTGIRNYGTLASVYVNDFDEKWVHNQPHQHEKLMGSSDIQSLDDLANSFQVVQKIQAFPFDKNTILQLIIFTLIPVLPLTLTMIPLEKLILKFIQLIL